MLQKGPGISNFLQVQNCRAVYGVVLDDGWGGVP